jgi:protein SCO1/2
MRGLFTAILALVMFANAHADIPNAPGSIYNLEAELTNQSSASHGLDLYRGHPVLITMFYGSCPMACPLLIDTLRATQRALGAQEQRELRVLMISIDPQRDTTTALQRMAMERHIDRAQWTLARADEKTVRKIAAALNIQYRKLPNGEFNHASVITLLSATGEIEAQSTVLGEIDPALVGATRRLIVSGSK